MKRDLRSRTAKAISILLLLAACQTGEVFISPPLKARVVDGITGSAIESVVVTMWSSEVPTTRQSGITDRNGEVSLPRLVGHLNAALPFVTDRILPPAVARFEKPGYVPKELNSGTDTPYFAGAEAVRLLPVP